MGNKPIKRAMDSNCLYKAFIEINCPFSTENLKTFLCLMKNPRVIAALTGILAMDPVRGLAMMQMVANELKGTGTELNVTAEFDEIVSRPASSLTNSNFYTISEYGYSNSPDDAEEGTIAIIPFLYPITKYDWWWAGTETKAAQLQQCISNKNIVAIIQLMDSPGGEADAPECYVKVAEKSDKPIITVSTGIMASAAYWIGSCGWEVIATSKLDQIGSVGVLVTFMNYSKYFEDMGIKIEDIYASLSTQKNNSYREALKGNFKPLIADLDYINYHFIGEVTKFRGEKFDDIENVQHGQLYFAEDAQKHGLIDSIIDMEQLKNHVDQTIFSHSQTKMTQYVY